MPIDSSIYGAVGRGVKSVQDYDNEFAQARQNKLAETLNLAKMDEFNTQRRDDAQLRDLTRQAGGDQNKLRDLVYGAGNYKQGMAIDKSIAEQRKAKGDADAQQFKLASERYSIYQKTVGALSQEPNLTKDMVLQAGQNLVQQGILSPELFQQSTANLPDDPMQLRATLSQGVKAQMTPEQIFTVFAPKPERIDNGQQISFRDTNPNSPTYGQATGGASVQKQQSPDSRASVGASLANAAATREVASATRDAARIGKQYESEQGLRKEFEALPEIKKYKGALPAFKGIEDAVKRNTPQSDINIVYGIAKLYDPESVVREGEYATVANSPNIPERVKGYAQYLAGGGRLTEKVKADILAEARSRMQSFDTEYAKARTDFESIATRTGVDPTRVFPSKATPAVGNTTAPNIDALLDKYK